MSYGKIFSLGDVVTLPSGINGSIQFSNGNAFASDSANLFWDNTNKRLGIGTSTPTHKLEQQGGGTLLNMTGGGANSFSVQRGGSTLLKVGTDNASIFLTADSGNNGKIDFIKLNGTSLMSVSDLGPVLTIKGIGTTSATTSLLVQNSSSQTKFAVDDSSVGTSILIGNLVNGYASLQWPANNVGIGLVGGGGIGMTLSGSGGFTIGTATTISNTASAMVDINSTTKGFLPPRLSTTQKNAIASPAEGLMVMDITLHKLCVYSGTAWETITSV